METTSSSFSEIAGECCDLDELIAYQPGTFVSRVLLQMPTATLTVFAVAEGERISEHRAPHEAVIQVFDGTATVTIADEDHTVAAGQVIGFPPDVTHVLDASE